MNAANENLFIINSDGERKKRLPDGWQNYNRTAMTSLGPIGFTAEGFQYLDPEIAAKRAI